MARKKKHTPAPDTTPVSLNGKKQKGMHPLTASELTNKSRQQLHDEVKQSYWIQLIDGGTTFLSPAKYDTLEKLAAYKAKHPGCYMKNNLNKLKATFDNL